MSETSTTPPAPATRPELPPDSPFLAALNAASYEEGLRLCTETLMEDLLLALRESGLPKPELTIQQLKASGLDRLLTRALGRGRLTLGMVNSKVDEMRRALSDRKVTANELRDGILAFDECAIRLAFVAGRNGSFEYSPAGNGPRDLLYTFARSLHR